jgi:penicillin-binding protein 1A
VAVQIGAEIRRETIATLARELGIRSPLRPEEASFPLGTSEVTLLELTSAYVPFANGGRPVRPHAAVIALNPRGEMVWRRDSVPLRPAMSAATLQAMRGLLRAVVTVGSGREALLRDRWNGGKTGTTSGDRDAWFVGLTDRLTTGVWFGNDDSPMVDVWGGGMPALAWRQFNEAIAARPFPESAAALADGAKAGSTKPGRGARQRAGTFGRAASQYGGVRSY